MRRKLLEQCDVCGKDLFAFLFDHHYEWKVQRCVTCGLVQVIPRPTEKEVAHLYHDDFDHFQPYLDQLSVHRKYFNRKITQISAILASKITQERTILDIGCAMGVLLEEAKKRGLYLNSDTVSNIQLMPPLIIKKEELDRGIAILCDCIKDTR